MSLKIVRHIRLLLLKQLLQKEFQEEAYVQAPAEVEVLLAVAEEALKKRKKKRKN
jgi:hypothetical protein